MKQVSIDPAKRWPKERWRPVPGYEKLYLISDQGQLWCIRSQDLGFVLNNRSGHRVAKLVRDGEVWWPKVEAIVAQAFVKNDNPIVKVHVGHLNSDRRDNRAGNLIWQTRAELIARLKKATHDDIEKGPMRYSRPYQLNPQDVSDIKAAHVAGASIRVLAKEYGVNTNSIYHVINGITWRDVK